MYSSKLTLEFLNLECYFVLLSCWPKKQQNILTTIVLTFTNLIHFNKWWPKMLMAIYHFVFWHEQEFLFFSSPCHISLYEERKLGYSLLQQKKTLLRDLPKLNLYIEAEKKVAITHMNCMLGNQNISPHNVHCFCHP